MFDHVSKRYNLWEGKVGTPKPLASYCEIYALVRSILSAKNKKSILKPRQQIRKRRKKMLFKIKEIYGILQY